MASTWWDGTKIFHPDLPKDVVVQSWRGVDSLAAGARQGYQGILSAPYYLNAMQSAEMHYLADPLPAGNGLTPSTGIAGSGRRGVHVGGADFLPGHRFSHLARTAAIAERFWSPADVRDVNDMYRRLAVMSLRLDSLGLTHISGPQWALRELADERNPEALTAFASVLTQVSFDERYDGQHTDQLTPLDRLADAVIPDPPSRHGMEVRVARFLADAPRYEIQRDNLEETFRAWRDLPPSLEYMLTYSPRLSDAAPRAQQLVQLGQVGLDATFYLSHHITPPADWKQKADALLADAEKPQALVRFTFLPPLRKLIDAAAGQTSAAQ